MKIAVLGGGISGLSTAYFLKKELPNASILLIESQKWGGWISSLKRDNTLFETGPRTLRPHGEAGAFTLGLVHELGLENRLLKVEKNSLAAKNRFVYAQSELQKLPASVLSILLQKPRIFNGIPKEIVNEFFNRNPRKIYAADESINSFFTRRFGENTANLASAIIHGIYAGDVHKLSVKSTLGFLSDLEEKYGSVGKGVLRSMFEKRDGTQQYSKFVQDIQNNTAIYSFKDGLQEFSDRLLTLLSQASNVKLIQDTCKRLVFDMDNRPKIVTETGQEEVDYVISALPAYSLAKLLNKDDKIKDISVILDSIPSVSVGVVNLAYPAFVKLPVSGFGYLIPQSENENESILGTIFDSDAMPHQSQMPVTRLTVMMGGYRFDSLFGNPSTVSKDRLLKVATEAVKKHLGITFDPLDSLVNVHQKCIPQYLVGHRQKMSVLHHLLCTSKVFKKRLSVVGASYTGVSVNDCVFESYKSVQRFSKGMENGITGLEKFI